MSQQLGQGESKLILHEVAIHPGHYWHAELTDEVSAEDDNDQSGVSHDTPGHRSKVARDVRTALCVGWPATA